MLTIGLDVHQRLSVVCILDVKGKRIKEFRVRGHCSKLIAELGKLEQPFAICHEASCGYGYLYDELSRIARRVQLAHPGHLRLIFRSKQKNGRVDARKPATLLYLEQVPSVHVPSVDVRDWRALIEFRNRLIGKRTRAKNGLRGLLRNHGVESPYGRSLWTKKGLAWLSQVAWPGTAVEVQRDLLLDELTQHTQRVRRLERELNRIGRQNTAVHLLRTIPGVGPRTAEAVVAYVDDPMRFARSKQVGSYFGLTPSQDQSGAVNRLGHITREGPGTVRKLLSEACWQAVRRSERIRAKFEQFQHGGPQRKKIALLATAHWLVRVMFTMLRSGEAWQTEEDRKDQDDRPRARRQTKRSAA